MAQVVAASLPAKVSQPFRQLTDGRLLRAQVAVATRTAELDRVLNVVRDVHVPRAVAPWRATELEPTPVMMKDPFDQPCVAAL